MKTLISSLLIVSCLFASCVKKEVTTEEDFIVPTLYYRLEMVDLDSTIVYSNIVATKIPITITQFIIQGIEIPTNSGVGIDLLVKTIVRSSQTV